MFIYCLHNGLTLPSVLSQVNRVKGLPLYFNSILILSSHVHLDLSGFFFFLTGLPKNFDTNYPSILHVHATRPAHLIFRDFIAIIKIGECYKVIKILITDHKHVLIRVIQWFKFCSCWYIINHHLSLLYYSQSLVPAESVTYFCYMKSCPNIIACSRVIQLVVSSSLITNSFH